MQPRRRLALKPHAPALDLDRVVFVMDRPRDVANIGGMVRAMGNFGLLHLRLVEPSAYDEERVRAMAHRGADVIAALERCPSLESALADCDFVLSTTARAREVRHERLSPRQAAPALLQAVARDPAARVAVLFGPEDHGLSNEALGRCNATITIPTVPDDPSLNLAQAALLIAYELWLSATAQDVETRRPDVAAALDDEAPRMQDSAPTPEVALARGAAREEMFAALETVLWGMHPNNDAGRVQQSLARLRAVLLRAAPRVEETRMLTRLFVHIIHERRGRAAGKTDGPTLEGPEGASDSLTVGA